MPRPAVASTDRPRQVFSRFYAHISRRMEAEGMGALRDELLGNATGEVVEIGAGNGMNFAHYPAAVTRVAAVEPEPHLRGLAEHAARDAPVAIRVLPGTAERLPLPDASVDAAVLCLVLCGFADRQAALAELVRVLRPGGTLHFLEHTFADTPGLQRVQRLADATVWPLLAGGCHTAGDPVGDIIRAGFELTAYRRLRFPEGRFTHPAHTSWGRHGGPEGGVPRTASSTSPVARARDLRRRHRLSAEGPLPERGPGAARSATIGAGRCGAGGPARGRAGAGVPRCR